MKALLPFGALILTAVCVGAAWWSHNDLWLVGVGLGLLLQAFGVAYATEE